MASDIFLVKKAQKGSKEAFVQLIQGYERILYNTAYRFLRNEQDVADVLQETILTAYQKINQLQRGWDKSDQLRELRRNIRK